MVYFVFIKTPDQLIALLGFVVLGHIFDADDLLGDRMNTNADGGVVSRIAVNCGESFTCVFMWNGIGFLGISLYDLQISPNHYWDVWRVDWKTNVCSRLHAFLLVIFPSA